MKPPATTLRALQSCRQATVARSFSTTARARNTAAAAETRDTAAEAESSTKYTVFPDETPTDAWKRNLEEVRAWRRRQAAIDADVSVYVPESVKGPRKAPQNVPWSPTEASLSTLLASGAALGHAKELLNPPYSPYIYGTRSGLSIIDLEQTLPLLRRSAALVRDVVKDDGVILFLGTRKAHKKMLEKARARLEDNGFMVNRWMPGTITNSVTYFGTEPLRKGIVTPDLVVVLNPSENFGAIRECTSRNVPTIGLIDSDTDPRLVTYPIPANMESVRTAELVLGTLSIAGAEGRRLRLLEAERRMQRKAQAAEARAARDAARMEKERKRERAEGLDQETVDA